VNKTKAEITVEQKNLNSSCNLIQSVG